jgi:hypothetical protein
MPRLKHFFHPAWRDKYLKTRTPDELREDVVEAFDQISSLKLQVKMLIAVVAAEGTLIKWLADKLYSCVGASHAVASQLVH